MLSTMTFRPPVRDLTFALSRIAGLEQLAPFFPDFDPETLEAVLEAAGDLAAGVLAPSRTAA
jgi:hypothetical protein